MLSAHVCVGVWAPTHPLPAPPLITIARCHMAINWNTTIYAKPQIEKNKLCLGAPI